MDLQSPMNLSLMASGEKLVIGDLFEVVLLLKEEFKKLLA